ncbi:MAG: hypothetical protein JXQ71_06405 [Verrucomicrobia bacterium]|nr:hypothetical protein [Verrucomicrobiota bacterium]
MSPAIQTPWIQDRRSFLKSTAALAALAAWPMGCATGPGTLAGAGFARRRKSPGLVRGAFFYPPAQVVLDGKCEDGWRSHQWFTWPGNQFAPEQQQAKFTGRLREIVADLDLTLKLEDGPLSTDAAIGAFVADVERSKPEALLLINFWNSFSPKLKPILAAFKGPIIVYQPVGANHQLPPEFLRTAPRVQYIHSVENWDALERGLRAVHAKVRLAQSRLLRVSGQLQRETDHVEPFFKLPIHGIPTAQFNRVFDEFTLTDEHRALARAVRRRARSVTDLKEQAFLDAVRAHAAVGQLLERHEADAITIECLFLKHRKPCLSFALNNGALVPCGCENDLDATLTLLLGASLFGRGGFQHNPEFDTEHQHYFASHCTCATRLHGPDQPEAPYHLRPFFHQLPKTLALDVQWPAGQPATLFKYQSAKTTLNAWRGRIITSPTCPPTGGCATRVLVKIEGVDDVCSVYCGPHPVLYCGDFARHARAFAQLYPLALRTNA